MDAAKGHLEQLMFATAEHIKEGAQWRLKAQAFDGYTRALMSVGLWREALWVLHKWLLLAEKVRDKGEQARVHGLTGVVHLREGSLSLAMTVSARPSFLPSPWHAHQPPRPRLWSSRHVSRRCLCTTRGLAHCRAPVVRARAAAGDA